MPTRAQLVAAAAALGAAFVGLFLGTRTVNNPLPTRACVTFDGTKPATLETLRFYGVHLSPQAQTLLGFSPVRNWDYVAMEVQYVPGTSPAATIMERLKENVEIVDEVEVRATPLFPNCQIAAVRDDDAAYPARCACSTGSNCEWDEKGDGNWVPAPRDYTMNAGAWRGAGCRKKVCVELGGSSSMPAACIP